MSYRLYSSILMRYKSSLLGGRTMVGKSAITWLYGAKAPSALEIERFEVEWEVKLSDEHKPFLQTKTNGGKSLEEKYIDASDCPGGAAGLQGVYEINVSEDYYDLGDTVSTFRFLLPCFVPFGYDSVNGQLFIDMQNGHLIYSPIDEIRDPVFKPYFVASSIEEFLNAHL